jgi:hypothetical protein
MGNSASSDQSTRVDISPAVFAVDFPTYYDLVHAAYLFKQMAAEENLVYAFAGRFAARITRGDTRYGFKVRKIEFILEPALRNNDEAFCDLIRRRKELAITPNDQLVILIGPTRGILLHCIAAGDDGYPDRLTAPYNSFHHTPEHVVRAFEPTFRMVPIGMLGRTFEIPVVRWGLGLQQRFRRLDLDSTDHSIHTQNKDDLVEIKTFLETAVRAGEGPLALETIAELQPRLERVPQYAATKGHEFEDRDWENLSKMGFRIPGQAQSDGTIGIPSPHSGPILWQTEDGSWRHVLLSP